MRKKKKATKKVVRIHAKFFIPRQFFPIVCFALKLELLDDWEWFEAIRMAADYYQVPSEYLQEVCDLVSRVKAENAVEIVEVEVKEG